MVLLVPELAASAEEVARSRPVARAAMVLIWVLLALLVLSVRAALVGVIVWDRYFRRARAVVVVAAIMVVAGVN
jgi:hypothetical protein